jgi:hypothetical protein
VNPGASAIFDFTPPTLPSAFRYDVTNLAPVAQVGPFLASGEIFDSTGATTVAHPPEPCKSPGG